MPRTLDNALKTPEFKSLVQGASDYARDNALPEWPTKVAWLVVVLGPQTAKRFVSRRPKYQTSEAWTCYQRLVQGGFVREVDGSVVLAPTNVKDPMQRFHDLVYAAYGAVH